MQLRLAGLIVGFAASVSCQLDQGGRPPVSPAPPQSGSPGTITDLAVAAVTRGSCATPVTGTTIGAHHRCTVLGLTIGTSYQFQVVAFRGTLNRDAVFGELSNVAGGQP